MEVSVYLHLPDYSPRWNSPRHFIADEAGRSPEPARKISANIGNRTYIFQSFFHSLVTKMSQLSFKILHIIYLHSSVVLQAYVGPWPFLQFRHLFYTDNRTPWTGDQPVARPLPTHRTTQTQNKLTQTSMPWGGFEPTIPAFERAKLRLYISNITPLLSSIVLWIVFWFDRDRDETFRTLKQRENFASLICVTPVSRRDESKSSLKASNKLEVFTCSTQQETLTMKVKVKLSLYLASLWGRRRKVHIFKLGSRQCWEVSVKPPSLHTPG
jgi:hypothetical protein